MKRIIHRLVTIMLLFTILAIFMVSCSKEKSVFYVKGDGKLIIYNLK